MPLLPYGAQCDELRKIEKLEPPANVRTGPPPGLASKSSESCTVCGMAEAYSCATCRAVAYCCAEHQVRDWHWHARVCPRLSEIAEDAALLDASTPDGLCEGLIRRNRGASVAADWTEYLGRAPDPARAEQRVFTALASRPLTLARWIDRLDLAATAERVRIHVIGASHRELEVPPSLYEELSFLWPAVEFELLLVGPELPEPRESALSHQRLRFRLVRGLYRRALWEHVGRPDLVVGFHCGLLVYPSWGPTMRGLLGSGPPIVLTSYRGFEQDAEARLLERVGAKSVALPERNPFASLSARRSNTIANDVTWDNAFAMVVR
jgi:hypothetical protein